MGNDLYYRCSGVMWCHNRAWAEKVCLKIWRASVKLTEDLPPHTTRVGQKPYSSAQAHVWVCVCMDKCVHVYTVHVWQFWCYHNVWPFREGLARTIHHSIHVVQTVFLAGKSPYIRSCTVQIPGAGQPPSCRIYCKRAMSLWYLCLTTTGLM